MTPQIFAQTHMPVEELTTDAAEWPSFADRQIAVARIVGGAPEAAAAADDLL
jgi:hypothetical protein